MKNIFKTLFISYLVLLSALSSIANASCNGKIINPVTDVCWSCIFPIKLAGVTLVSGKNPDPETDANTICMCISGADIRIGLNMSFWEPIRTAEVVRQPYCFPSLGGLNLDFGLRAPAHGRTPKKTAEQGRTSFYQVHWYFTPWLFILQALLDTDCLEQSAWDLAYMTELDPLWDDSVTTFFLNPDVSLFANPVAQAACAADCVSSTASLPSKTLYWCAGCNGNIFPLAGWVAAHLHLPQASSLLAIRFLMKLHRQGLEWAAYGEKGQCGPYLEPVMDKSVYRMQMVYPSRTTAKIDGRCCYPLGASTALWSSGKTWAGGGEDAAYLMYRKRDCCQGSGISSL